MICEPLVGQPISECIKGNQHLSSLELADFAEGGSTLTVDTLIGSDYYWKLVTGGVCKGESGPVGIHTKLGWVLSGPAKFINSSPCYTNLATTHVPLVDTQLDDRLRSFWELESLGIGGPEKTIYKYDEFLSLSLSVKGDIRCVCRGDSLHQLSLQRLRGLLKRLRHLTCFGGMTPYKSRSKQGLWRMFQQMPSHPPKFIIFPTMLSSVLTRAQPSCV